MFVPNPTHEAIIKVVNDYHYLMVDQVQRLVFQDVKHKLASKYLLLLTNENYLYRERDYKNGYFIYFLAKRGADLLKRQGREVHYYTKEHNNLSSWFLLHEVAVSEFLIAANRIPTLISWHHDLTLKRKMTGLVPDGWMVFSTGWAFWLELDRGTIEQKRVREKLNAMLDFFEQGRLEEIFTMPPNQTFRLRFVFATTAGVKRRDNLITWIDAVLEERYDLKKDQDTYAGLFCVSDIPEGELDPQHLFYDPHWYTPRRTKAYPLLVC